MKGSKYVVRVFGELPGSSGAIILGPPPAPATPPKNAQMHGLLSSRSRIQNLLSTIRIRKAYFYIR
jgi:hypothetical protein